MSRITRIELSKEAMKFSAGHFTIFGPGARENMHGHNFVLQVEVDAAVSASGMAFDYVHVRRLLIELCHQWDEVFLLPANNPHLRLEDDGASLIAHFGDERIVFLKRDVRVLPVANITLEELSHLVLQALIPQLTANPEHGVTRIASRVFSGPGQSALSEWTR
jgi:6-pyruvoyltetrahydropterin/6-carboxytetrahydropterin synthase